LATLRQLGFILFPGVPNTTAVTQETDRNYGPFKTQFRINLIHLTDARIAAGESTSLQPWIVGLCVFGGECPTKTVEIPLSMSAFEKGFSKEACLSAWAKVGAAPCTRACLSDKHVRRELGDADDDTNSLMVALQEANDNAVALLTRHGYRATHLAAKMNRVAVRKSAVTVPHSKERILLLAKAKTHGEKFAVTNGDHLTSDDFFKSVEVNSRKKEITGQGADGTPEMVPDTIEGGI